MKITLNLASRPYADQGPAIKQLRIGMAALAVVLLGLSLGLLHFHQAAKQMAVQEDALDRSIANVRQEDVGYQRQMQQPDNAKVLTQSEFLNQLFEEKSFSWTAAMEDLERVLPAGVQVTAIEPSRGKDGRLTLRLRISGLRERSVEMVRNMERSPRFESPRIAGENAENASSQGDVQPVNGPVRVSFDVLAEYNPATLEERKAQIATQRRPSSAAASRPSGNLRQPSGVRVGLGNGPGNGQGYVPPNPQNPQLGVPGPYSRQFPGGVPAAQRQILQRQGMPGTQGIPIGRDLNGLRNHEGNRFPPGQVPPEGTIFQPQGPQPQIAQPGGPQ